MKFKKWGKYNKTNSKKPQAFGVCDRTGFVVMHYDLKPQYQYAGSGKVNTGFLIHKNFIDKLNPQQLAPKAYLDPIPVPNPRTDNPDLSNDPVNLTINMDFGTEREISIDELNYTEFTLIGNPIGNFTLIVPSQFKSFIIKNESEEEDKIFMQMKGFTSSSILLKANTITYVTGTGLTLLVTNTVEIQNE